MAPWLGCVRDCASVTTKSQAIALALVLLCIVLLCLCFGYFLLLVCLFPISLFCSRLLPTFVHL